MAFTRGWDNTTPPGTRDADEIDDIIRELKVDLYERLIAKIFNSLPNTTVEADLVVRPEILGNVVGKRMYIHGSAFQVDADEGVGEYSDDGLAVTPNHDPLRAPLILPPGAKVTRIQWLISSTASATCTLRLCHMDFTVGMAQTVDNDLSSGTTGARIVDSGDLTATPIVIGNAVYFLRGDQSGSAGLPSLFEIHGVLILYTVDDCRITL